VEEELRTLRAEMSELRKDVEALIEKQRRQEQTLADLRSSLGG
jgi:predicted  nucleic acid-binding Zn-ribbon protein